MVENKFVESIIGEVVCKLKGSHSTYSRLILTQVPHRFIILGSLAPKIPGGKDTDQNFDSFENEEKKTIISERVKSVSFLVDKIDNLSIGLEVEFYVFYRVPPSFEEQLLFLLGYEGASTEDILPDESKIDEILKKIEHKMYPIASVWERKKVYIKKSVKIDDFSQLLKGKKILLKKDALKALEESFANEKIRVFRYTLNPRDIEILTDKEKFEREINKLTKEKSIEEISENCLGVYLLIQGENYHQQGENLYKIKISLINDSIYDKKMTGKYYMDPAIFDCKLTVHLNANIRPFIIKDRYLNAEKKIFVRASNWDAKYFKDERKIITENYLIYREPRILPRVSPPDNPAVPGFLVLSNLDNGGFDTLRAIYNSLEKYYGKLVQQKPELIESVHDMLTRYQEGLSLLKSDANAKRAFELMNETFSCYSQRRGYDSWRLFQIVFIVSNLSDVVNLTNLEWVDLLNVSTGGGKTEAYFGLCIFSAFYDRLIGRKFGTTAIVKFPLRMLSIQQLQRLIGLVAWSNYVKHREKIDGEDFSLGFFVGQSRDFPKSSLDIIEQLKSKEKGKFIDTCPICGSDVFMSSDPETYALYHVCSNKDCFLSRGVAIHYTQQEVYRFLPTFIVSTVDKMSAISYNRRFRAIIGGKVRKCKKGHGYIPEGDWCEVEERSKKNRYNRCGDKGEHIDNSKNVGPRLMIQDELHLIREGFGSIDAHFETLIETMKEEFTGVGLKHICTTATISGAEEQVHHLYVKKLRILPPESTFQLSEFFFEKKIEDGKEIVGRYILGLRPNLRDNQYATLLTLRYVIETILAIKRESTTIARRLGISEEELNVLIRNYLSYLTYHTKKADVHTTDFYLKDVVISKFYYDDSINIHQILISVPLTGDDSTEDVKNKIKRLEEFEKSSEFRIYVTSATNIVSHGVDISSWNVMLFQGMPRSTAEYIQALSRVGRKATGIVFVWYYPNRVRDLDFYRNFNIYHETLNWHVEIVPITRWSKLAFDQTIPSVFCASILNYLSETKGAPIYSDKHFLKYLVNEESNEREVDENFELILELVKKAYTRGVTFPQSEVIVKLIPKKMEEIRKYLIEDIKYSNTGNYFPQRLGFRNSSRKYRLLYGLRGVQDMVYFEPDTYTDRFLRENCNRGDRHG